MKTVRSLALHPERRATDDSQCSVINEFDYSFSENGLVAYHNGAKIGETVSSQSPMRTARCSHGLVLLLL